jgi:mono/diheme cytochrome c family protein
MRNRVVALGAGLLSLVNFSQPLAAQDQRAVLARGEYLVNAVAGCGNCHTQRGPDLLADSSKTLAGGNRFDIPPGLAFAKNITPDRDTGIGSWTEEQIIRALREGVTKEGNIIGPPMPIEFYNKLSDDDVKAIAAYVRSVKAIRNEVQESKYRIPLHAAPAVKDVKAPAKTDKVAYGGYLATVAHCVECHTPQVGPKRDFEKQMGAGGFRFEIGGKFVFSRNITSDRETGIGAWSDEQIKRAITQGVDKDGKQLIPQMPYPYFKNMTAEDLDAVVAWVRTLPPVKKEIAPNPSLQTFLQK